MYNAILHVYAMYELMGKVEEKEEHPHITRSLTKLGQHTCGAGGVCLAPSSSLLW